MRIRLLSIIASYIALSLAITSCLNSDNNYELGSDNIITEFELDKIFGVNYKFTIDQVRGHIFNQDSVPHNADTIIDKILITTLSTGGYITAGKTALEDTLFNYTDSIDFSNTMEDPLEIRVRSYDGDHIKEYKIEVRIHQQDPDSLVWGKEPITTSFSNGIIKADHQTRTIALQDKILIYAWSGSNIVVYNGPVVNTPWPTVTTNLPDNIKLVSMLNYNDRLYVATEDSKVFSSIDGSSWNEVNSNLSVSNLISTFSSNNSEGAAVSICGITQAEEETGSGTQTVYRFSSATIDEGDGSLSWIEGDVVPEGFPTENLSATKSYKTTTGMHRVLAVGKPIDTEATQTNLWFTLNGLNWAEIESNEEYAIPAMNNPSIIFYNKQLYAFGGDFSTIYTSTDGIVWKEIEEKFMFPSDEDGVRIFKYRTGYSMTVDKDNYIWITWGRGISYSDEVWKGRLNRLGFIIQ